MAGTQKKGGQSGARAKLGLSLHPTRVRRFCTKSGKSMTMVAAVVVTGALEEFLKGILADVKISPGMLAAPAKRNRRATATIVAHAIQRDDVASSLFGAGFLAPQAAPLRTHFFGKKDAAKTKDAVDLSLQG